MHEFCSELEVAGLAWPVPPSLPPQAGSTQSHQHRGADCSKKGTLSVSLHPACPSPGTPAIAAAHPNLLSEGRGPFPGEIPHPT